MIELDKFAEVLIDEYKRLSNSVKNKLEDFLNSIIVFIENYIIVFI